MNSATAAPHYSQTRMRKLSGFVESFYEHKEKVEAATHANFDINNFALKSVYLSWVDVFEGSAELDAVDKWNYLDYLGGQGLYSLMKHAPVTLQEDIADNLVTAEAQPEAIADLLGLNLADGAAALPDIVRFWPVGFLYVSFCLSAIAKIEHREIDQVRTLTPSIIDLQGFWWSFRENVSENPATAIPFFDLLLDNQPNWRSPFDFNARENRGGAVKQLNR